MKLGWILAVGCAVMLHIIVLLFGGVLFRADEEDHGTLQQVELLEQTEAEKEKLKPDEPKPEEAKLETKEDEPPDARELTKSLEPPALDDAPALDAASLSAIEQALNGQGGGDFSDAIDFASGGRIGGTGKGGSVEQQMENAFSLAEIDQKPRPILQSAPNYPSEMRGKKIEGIVTLIFVVESSGKVSNPRVESSTHPAFDRPALDAVRHWKFEPALKGGQRVNCKMRVPIRFQPS